MKKHLKNILQISLLILLSGCDGGTNEIISTFRVQKSDFVDAVSVEGFAEPVRSLTVSCPPEIDGTVLRIIDDGTFVNAGDEICVIEDKNLMSEYEESLRSLENAEANVNKVRADHQLQLAILEAQQRTNNAETMIAGLDSLQLKYSSENQRKIKELEMQRSAIEKSRFEKKFRATRQIQQAEIRGLEIQMQRFRMRVEIAKQRLEALTIKAPQAGMVIIARSPMSGRKIVPGDNIWQHGTSGRTQGWSHPIPDRPQPCNGRHGQSAPRRKFGAGCHGWHIPDRTGQGRAHDLQSRSGSKRL